MTSEIKFLFRDFGFLLFATEQAALDFAKTRTVGLLIEAKQIGPGWVVKAGNRWYDAGGTVSAKVALAAIKESGWRPAVGDLCWFVKSMNVVRVVELPDPNARDYKGLFTVERIDSKKQMLAPIAGLKPYSEVGECSIVA